MIRFLFCMGVFLWLGFSCPITSNNKDLEEDADIIQSAQPEKYIEWFFQLFAADLNTRNQAIKEIRANWVDGFIPIIMDILSLTRDPWIQNQLFTLLAEETGVNYGKDFHRWLTWLWNREEMTIEKYADFKAMLYSQIDPVFEKYFLDRDDQTLIRLDEVRWGGVLQDGIPPLRSPKMLSADEAGYLDDDHLIFGIEINGDARAYPKRILAWHEMFTDRVGGVPIAGVYCTLCGTVVIYETTYQGIEFDLGTSGFLYRSNKLMYDKATQSLWNTLLGQPVVGPLISSYIRLSARSVVTTNWGEWKKRHQNTTVLSLDTGYSRDYGEGIAYKDYFATDQLMFPVPLRDDRLKNKDEVFVIRPEGFREDPLAVSVNFLNRNPVYHDSIAGMNIVVLTDRSGANRSYNCMDVHLVSFDGNTNAVDEDGNIWMMNESALINKSGVRLWRMADHRAFWFGWYAMFPETRLVE